MGTHTAETLAAETLEIMAQRCREACAYAEAYGHSGRTLVVDGSQYSPSTRALPNGSRAWDMDDDDFATWDEIVTDGLDQLEVPCDDSDEEDPSYVWTFSWDDGCLFGIHPDAVSEGWLQVLRPNVTPVQRTQLHKPAVTAGAVRDGVRATGVAPTEFVDVARALLQGKRS